MPSTEPDRVNDRTIKHDYRFYTILGISKHMTIGVDSSNRIERARNVAERICLYTAISIFSRNDAVGNALQNRTSTQHHGLEAIRVSRTTMLDLL